MSPAVTPDPETEALLDPLWAQLDALLSGVIGQSTVAVPRSVECRQSSGRHCESLIGDVVTDAMRGRYGTDFAITNSGGLLADLTCPDPDVPGDFCPPPDGGDLEITDGTCSADAVDLTAGTSYSHAENHFMASGADGYPADIGSAVTRELLDQVTAAYVTANTPISPAIQGRITCTALSGGTCPTAVP